MSTIKVLDDKNYDHEAVEAECRDLWDETRIYEFDPQSGKPVFSIDTPPPYVSAAHLHVGHAMSYSQAEFIVRQRRMAGYEVFYPMGFDDNGLPTERYVEQTYKVDKKTISRADFRQLCIDETAKGAVTYEAMWRALGLSVDWRLRYSTIDDHCRHTAQASFLDLYKKNLIYRANEPVLWDTKYETALAQADLETLERKGKLYDIRFSAPDGTPLVISTTRPELIPACVALYFNPEDGRYAHLAGGEAIVPLTGHAVPIKTSAEVKTDFGTGLMMVCTFGDGEDVRKWKEDKLDTRLVINQDGKLNDLAGKYAGLDVQTARGQIAKDLREAGLVEDERNVEQAVSVGERSGVPVEFAMAPQWFVSLLDKKQELLARGAELGWFPDWMKARLDHWIEGLKYDWNISRQRFYGVPFPLWYVEETGDVILADPEQLPVDPTEDAPPQWAREKYKGMTITGEADVMETWFTSSMTPLINANWVGTPGRIGTMDVYPMSVRVQAFEIIRTWLFYTLVKSHFHTGSLPWKEVMISGWGLNEQGKKISKRDLEKFTDQDGYNRYDPYSLVRRFGADAVRYWAAGSHLGNDLRFHEKDVKAGRKIVVKLWNVARLATMHLEGFDPSAPRPPVAERTIEDRWVLVELNRLVETLTRGFETYDYAIGREALERFFWRVYCDNYVELIKDRFWTPERHSDASRLSAQATLYESLRTLTALFAPYLPFITEALFQRIFKPLEGGVSIHVSDWPAPQADVVDDGASEAMDLVLGILAGVRFLRSEAKVSQTRRLDTLTVECPDDATRARVEALATSLLAATHAARLEFGSGETDTPIDGIRVAITVAEQEEAAE
ncbi:MAG: valine--tRNA ligase [Azospirillaceae bacterium]